MKDIEVNITQQNLPEEGTLQSEVEYPLSILITSFSGDTDQKMYAPNVPG